MKNCRYILCIALCFLAFSACEEDGTERSPDIKAEIIGQDYSRWICGGGWIISTGTDTVMVHNIPNEEVMAILASSSYTGEPPLKVSLSFKESPESTCAIQFGDKIKELESIHLAN